MTIAVAFTAMYMVFLNILGSFQPLKPFILHSGLFSNQKISHKCLNINFGGFIFEVSIFR